MEDLKVLDSLIPEVEDHDLSVSENKSATEKNLSRLLPDRDRKNVRRTKVQPTVLESPIRLAKDDKTALTEDENDLIKKMPLGPIKPLKKGSKDDFGIVSEREETRLESYRKQNKWEVELIEKPSLISRFFSYIVEKVQPIVTLWTEVSNTKAGKVLLGSAMSRTVTILFATAVISGLWPPAIPFVVTAAIISLTAVTAGVIIDTVKTRTLRKLAAESDLLVKNRGEISKQDYILEMDPKLTKILSEELYRPKEQVNKYKVKTNSEWGLSASKVLSDSAPSVVNFTATSMIALSGSPVAIANAVKNGVVTVASLIGGGVNAKYSVDVAAVLKLHINEEHQYAGNYSNLIELKQNVQEQHIKTLALTELVRDKDYFKLTDDQKKVKFHELAKFFRTLAHVDEKTFYVNEQRLAEIDKEIKTLSGQKDKGQAEGINRQVKKLREEKAKIKEYFTPKEQPSLQNMNMGKEQKKGIVQDVLGEVAGHLKDAVRAHDPFYEQPSSRTPDTEFTQLKAKAKKVATPEVKEFLPAVDQQKFGTNLGERAQKMPATVDQKDLKKGSKDDLHLTDISHSIKVKQRKGPHSEPSRK